MTEKTVTISLARHEKLKEFEKQLAVIKDGKKFSIFTFSETTMDTNNCNYFYRKSLDVIKSDSEAIKELTGNINELITAKNDLVSKFNRDKAILDKARAFETNIAKYSIWQFLHVRTQARSERKSEVNKINKLLKETYGRH